MALIQSDSVSNLLQTFLNVQSRRAQVIAGNIANADTPGFKAKELMFDDYLKEAAKQSALPFSQQDWNGVSQNQPKVAEQTPTAISLDGNTVDAAREMSELAQAGTNFSFGVKMLQSRLHLLRTAIREGK